MIKPILLAPLASSMLYALGALVLKRSTDLGAGLWRTAFVVNLATALAYQPLWLLGGHIQFDKMWQPLVITGLYLAGQTLNLLALDRGDVSVATPVLGIKIVLVALLVTLWGAEPVGVRFWVAAGLATVAVAVLNRRAGAHHHHVGFTIVTACLSSLAFALFDVLTRRWAPAWGIGVFLPLVLLMVAVASWAFVPLFHGPLLELSPAARRWLGGGAAILALQSVIFVSSVSLFGNVTAANIVFSARGLWSVILVWLVGHWFGNRERHLAGSVLRWRLAGAVLMLAAIMLILS